MESRENQKKCRTNKGILKPGIMILISALGCFFLVNKFSDGVNAPNFSVKTIHCFSDGVNTPKGYKIELSGETESINLVLRDVGLMTLFIVPILYDIFNGKRKSKRRIKHQGGEREVCYGFQSIKKGT